MLLPIQINLRRILAVALFVIVAAAVWLGVMGKTCDCNNKAQRVRGDFSSLTAALREYRKINGELPTTFDGLKALVSRPSHLPPDGPWRPLLEDLVRDPWGNGYFYFREDSLKDGFGLYTAGPDLQSDSLGNDENDINTWALDKPLPPILPHQRRPAFLIVATVFFSGGLAGIFLKSRPERLFKFSFQSAPISVMRRSPLSHFFHLLLLTVSLLYLGCVTVGTVRDRITAGMLYQRTRVEVTEIAKAVDGYRMETGALPATLEAVRVQAGGTRAESWSSGLPGSLQDCWNADYQFRVVPALPAGYGIYSFGMDGVSDSEGNDPDDVNSWTAPEKAARIDPPRPPVLAVAVAASIFGFVLKGLMIRAPEEESQP